MSASAEYCGAGETHDSASVTTTLPYGSRRPLGIAVVMADSKTRETRDHDEIRRWVKEHDGVPASVRGTEDGDEAGVLRIDFPGGAGENQLEHIEWEQWFDKFDDEGLTFLYQEQKASGEDSTFFKLIRS